MQEKRDSNLKCVQSFFPDCMLFKMEKSSGVFKLISLPFKFNMATIKSVTSTYTQFKSFLTSVNWLWYANGHVNKPQVGEKKGRKEHWHGLNFDKNSSINANTQLDAVYPKINQSERTWHFTKFFLYTEKMSKRKISIKTPPINKIVDEKCIQMAIYVLILSYASYHKHKTGRVWAKNTNLFCMVLRNGYSEYSSHNYFWLKMRIESKQTGRYLNKPKWLEIILDLKVIRQSANEDILCSLNLIDLW